MNRAWVVLTGRIRVIPLAFPLHTTAQHLCALCLPSLDVPPHALVLRFRHLPIINVLSRQSQYPRRAVLDAQ